MYHSFNCFSIFSGNAGVIDTGGDDDNADRAELKFIEEEFFLPYQLFR